MKIRILYCITQSIQCGEVYDAGLTRNNKFLQCAARIYITCLIRAVIEKKNPEYGSAPFLETSSTIYLSVKE